MIIKALIVHLQPVLALILLLIHLMLMYRVIKLLALVQRLFQALQAVITFILE